MEFTYFIGTDVSKNELDFAVMQGKKLLFHREIANKPESIKCFIKELFLLPEFQLCNSVFCMEHTGIYNNHLLAFLHKKKANVCLEVASQIKNSMGNVRGKNDKVDAIRIAEYAYKNREELNLWQPKREVIQRLAHLSASRSRLLDAQKMLRTPIKEAVMFVEKKVIKENTCTRTLDSIAIDLKRTEQAISEIIAADTELNRLFNIITSVPGVGEVTATQFLICTNEFRSISDPKKFACYAGVAPFIKESGLFKGKARVSPLANKKIKTLLHMSALTAIMYNLELKQFYQRKVAEGKNKMSVINAIRNKLVLRVFACINNNRKYNKTHTNSLA